MCSALQPVLYKAVFHGGVKSMWSSVMEVRMFRYLDTTLHIYSLSPCPGAPGAAARGLHHRARQVRGARRPRQLPLALAHKYCHRLLKLKHHKTVSVSSNNVANKYFISSISIASFYLDIFLCIYFIVHGYPWQHQMI